MTSEDTELIRTIADQAMITVPLTPPACEALKASSERSGNTDIDTVNQALMAWDARTKRLAIDASGTASPEAFQRATEVFRLTDGDLGAVVATVWSLAFLAGREAVDG